MRAGDDFDERGFPRAIFAEQRMDFARVKIERNAFERPDRAEGFADVGESEQWSGHFFFFGFGHASASSSILL